MNSQKLRLFLDSDDKKQRFKANSLKAKCILFQNQIIQIGMKTSLIYDFYTSKYYLQCVLFFGNKTEQPIKDFDIEYKGNKAIEMYVEEKSRVINEQSQHKQRILIGLFEPEMEPWLTLSFRWQALDIRSLLIPLSLIRFMNFKECTVDNYQLHQQTFKYTEESKLFKLGKKLFKNGLQQLPKLLPGLKKYTDLIYYGAFELGTQLNNFFLVLHLKRDEAKIQLSGNEQKYIPSLLSNLQFVLSEE